MDRNFYATARLLFVISTCPHCNIWKQFIESLNAKLPFDKRIKVIYCDRYYDYGIADDPLILKFTKIINGNFPLLVFDGFKIAGAESRLMLEQFMKTVLLQEFVTDETNEFLYTKQCEPVKSGFFKGRMKCD